MQTSPNNTPKLPTYLLLRLNVVLGAKLSLGAALALGFLGIAYVDLLPESDLLSRLDFRGVKDRVEGIVLGKEVASKDNEDGVVIWRVRYRYEVDGQSYRGDSFVSDVPRGLASRCLAGNCMPGPKPPAPGTKAQVEYRREVPGRSRLAIPGMRRRRDTENGMVAALAFSLPFLAVWLWTVRGGLRCRRLLRTGTIGHAVLVESKDVRFPWSIFFPGGSVLTFELVIPPRELRGGYRDQGRTEAWTHRFQLKVTGGVALALQDDPREPVLHDPDEPSNAIPVHAMPGDVRLEHGQLILRSWVKGLLAALSPLLVVWGYLYLAGFLLLFALAS